ncbi:hypothetical protein, partial [Rhizobium brockwellii]|uniref:hypothetical protein n=1 Tax=Rhizobium brockwellii TaxID=3019932 RepID=UPI003F98FE33
ILLSALADSLFSYGFSCVKTCSVSILCVSGFKNCAIRLFVTGFLWCGIAICGINIFFTSSVYCLDHLTV